jgi:hypothetical protein
MRVECVGNFLLFYDISQCELEKAVESGALFTNTTLGLKQTPRPTSGPSIIHGVPNFCLLQDINLWEAALNFHSSFVNTLLLSSLRYLETQKFISISKKAQDISSSWHPAGFACFMPDAGNIPLPERRLIYFESQKTYVQIFYGHLSSASQERQHHDISSRASKSHVLEPYFHPEMTEVGTLPSLGAMRAACVENIRMFSSSQVSNGFELVFTCDAEFNSSACITAGELIPNQKEYPSTYFLSVTQARQPGGPLLEDRHASQSYVLKPYFTTEQFDGWFLFIPAKSGLGRKAPQPRPLKQRKTKDSSDVATPSTATPSPPPGGPRVRGSGGSARK